MVRVQKVVVLIVLIAFTVTAAGCFTIRIGGKGELAPSTEKGTKIAEKRFWYALWGLVPLGDNSTDSLIPETAQKIRVETKYTLVDALINMFTIIVSVETFKAEIYEVK
jgi:hypothetical protein